MAGAQPREILDSQGATTPVAALAHEEERWRGLMSDTSQGLLQRRRDAEQTDWRDYAACRDVDPDLFFPLGTSGASLPQIEEAKQICRTCPVCGPCLRWALQSGDAGVWGGTTEDERRTHRQLRALRG
jgi:WhiB family transcriptional regulator, redox-sensing transcriptional regulator